MVDISKVLDQLSAVGYKTRAWQRSEVRELCNVLHEDEVIFQATNGHYEGGFSLLVATDTRLILVDRKPLFLTLDSIAYSMIQEVTFNYRLLNSTIHIYTSNKTLDFSSWNHAQIRAILTHVQAAMRNKGQMITDTAYYTDNGLISARVPTAEIDAGEIPTMPTPFYLNDNTQSAPTVNTVSVSPEGLAVKAKAKLEPYKMAGLATRQYVRRYY